MRRRDRRASRDLREAPIRAPSSLRSLRALLACVALAACTEKKAAAPGDGVPLLVRVAQAQSTPSFTHAKLAVFRDEGGRPTSMLLTSGCLEVATLPTGASGRRRLELAVAEGGPYYLQFTGHNEAQCVSAGAVAAAIAPGIIASKGVAAVVPIIATAIDRFSVITPPAGVANAEVVPRAFHSATVVSDGSLIVAGGAQEALALSGAACAQGFSRCYAISRATSGVHRFDPASGATVLIGALAQRRFLHSATLVPGPSRFGTLAITGGAQSATIAGAGSGADATFVRADPACTNPNDAAGSGCILRSIEAHRLDGSSPQLATLANGRASHAAIHLGAGKVLVAGGRESRVQRGCSSDAQCASGARCQGDGRCVRAGLDCSQVGDVLQVCPAGYTCDRSDGGRCVKNGCSSDAECGGCLTSGGCSTGTPSTCDMGSGLCTKRGCSVDSECLGSNRRCVQGNCAQVGCDLLSGCKAGTTCDVRSGKCKPDGQSIDCSQGQACACQGDGDCQSGFTCQTAGEFAGRCRNVQTGCPATVCRRDENDPAQGPYFDTAGNLRRDVNCVGGQCTLVGCLADVDCAPGFVCQSKICESGRRVTAPTRSVEICDLSAATLPARPCSGGAQLAVAREGLTAACLLRDGTGSCTASVLLGGNATPDSPAELRNGQGGDAGGVTLTGCGAAGSCTPSFVSAAEDAQGAVFFGGVAQSGGGSQYRFLTTIYRIAAASSSAAQILPSTLAAGRALASAIPFGDGFAVTGGIGDGFAARQTGTMPANGTRYEEPEALRTSTPRFGHTTTVLPDGRMVVIGGIDPTSGMVVPTSEVYTPRNALR